MSSLKSIVQDTVMSMKC